MCGRVSLSCHIYPTSDVWNTLIIFVFCFLTRHVPSIQWRGTGMPIVGGHQGGFNDTHVESWIPWVATQMQREKNSCTKWVEFGEDYGEYDQINSLLYSWKGDQTVVQQNLDKLTSKAAKLDAFKENIKMLVNGCNLEEIHTTWPHERKVHSAK